MPRRRRVREREKEEKASLSSNGNKWTLAGWQSECLCLPFNWFLCYGREKFFETWAKERTTRTRRDNLSSAQPKVTFVQRVRTVPFRYSFEFSLARSESIQFSLKQQLVDLPFLLFSFFILRVTQVLVITLYPALYSVDEITTCEDWLLLFFSLFRSPSPSLSILFFLSPRFLCVQMCPK